ncbi:MAG: peptidylprolyl isomerase, partial [Paludibacteraceae bacterium]
MKKVLGSVLAFTLTATLLTAQQSDPALMKINGKNIPLSEFEYIYNKNNSNNVVDKKSLDEYVDLFVNFKLKVEEALSQGLDTTQSFRSELGMYQNQLSEQYLNDPKAMDNLVKEAYDRKKEETEVSHILIRIPERGASEDTLMAYNKAMAIYKRAQKEDFEKLAREVSQDPSVAQNGGYVGWISAMRTPYSFENAVYSTPVGQVSKPVRTFIGYHIIKVINRRQSPGEVKVAHILLMNDRQNPAKNMTVKLRADSVYQRILAGDNFGELAVKYSQDPGSARQNGELPWFGSGQMIPEFEKAAFALKNKGDVTKPVESQYGWHIIKLLDKKPLGSFDELKSSLEEQIKQNERNSKVSDSFSERLKKEYNLTQDTGALADFLNLSDKYAPSDSLFKTEASKMTKPLFKFANKQYTQKDFANYLLSNASVQRGVRSDFINGHYKDFIKGQLVSYEQTQLDRKYPDFHNLMQEYHDGILLFDVMNKEVWDKASKDTEGLKKFFDAHKSDYAWAKPHYKGRIIYAKDKETLKAAQKIVKRAAPDSISNYLSSRLNDSIQYVKVEKGLWVEGENPAVDASVFKKGTYTPSKDYPYYFVTGKLLK